MKTDERLNLRPSKQEIEDFPLDSLKMDSFWCSLLGEDTDNVDYEIY